MPATVAQTISAGRVGKISLKMKQRLRHDGVQSLTWSPDGTCLVSYSGGREGYILWDPFAGRELRQLGQPWSSFATARQPKFTSDGRYVVVTPQNAKVGEVYAGFGLWNVASGNIDHLVPFPTRYFLRQRKGDPFFFSIPGQNRALVYFHGGLFQAGTPIFLYGTDTWEIVDAPVRLPEALINSIDLSPDGQLVAIGGGRTGPFVGDDMGEIWVHDLVKGSTLLHIKGAHKNAVGHLKFSPDGKFLTSAPGEIGANVRNERTAQLELMNDPDPVRIWDIATGQKAASFYGLFPGVSNVTFSPDGNWVAATLGTIIGMTDGPEMRIWNWRDGALLAAVGHRHWTASAEHVEFSPDGRHLAMAGTNKSGSDWIDIAEIITAA